MYSMSNQEHLICLEALKHSHKQEGVVGKEDSHNDYKGCAITFFLFKLLYIEVLYEEGRLTKVFQKEQA